MNIFAALGARPARNTLSHLDRQIAVANAAIAAEKARAAVLLQVAESDLNAAMRKHAAAPAALRPSYAAEVRARVYIRNMYANLAS